MARVFRSVQGRAQHGKWGRLFAVAADGRPKGDVYASLGMQDACLPMAVADLVPREAVATSPTDVATSPTDVATSPTDVATMPPRSWTRWRRAASSWCACYCRTRGPPFDTADASPLERARVLPSRSVGPLRLLSRKERLATLAKPRFR